MIIIGSDSVTQSESATGKLTRGSSLAQARLQAAVTSVRRH
jgi:hypothetical protein